MGRDVQAMFSSIARDYDRANTVLSFGVHPSWRRKAVRAAAVRPGDRVLDVATGTGDLAFAFRRAVGDGGLVVGADFARPMLEQAAAKTRHRIEKEGRKARGAVPPPQWSAADALRLPFRDATFDVASIAFGIRNVDDPARGLAEMARCVRPGGRLVVLEFGQARGPVGVPFRWYSRHVLPRVGGWLTGNRAAYEYLPRSVAAFPSGEAFLDLLRRAPRVHDATGRPLMGGIAWLYRAMVS